MLRFLRLLFGHDCPTRREMMATRDVCDALDKRVSQHYDELRQLRGKVNGMRRWEKAADEDDQKAPESIQVAPGTTNGQRRTVGIPRRNY